MHFNPYFLAAAVMVFVAVTMIVVTKYLWSLVFFGGALAMYFLGASSDADGGDGNAR